MNNKANSRTLVVAAHPDDEILGCGGTIAKLASRGEEIAVLFVAEGESARFRCDQLESAFVKQKIEERNSNAVKALGAVGVRSANVTFLNFPCCRLDQIPIIEVTKKIEEAISFFNPSCIFCNAANDTNIDHRVVFNATLAAARPLKSRSLRSIYCFEVLSSTEWNTTRPFRPTHFECITNFIDQKIEAMRIYGQELMDFPHSRSEQGIKALASYRGMQVGVKAAEGFELIRRLKL